ncbi:hypothetical protein DMC30DRAFT_450686, partial [Rhodotorula diobovata]
MLAQAVGLTRALVQTRKSRRSLPSMPTRSTTSVATLVPLRLPNEIILEIIEWRYKGAAERALYSKVRLSTRDKVREGTALAALVNKPALRPFVEEIKTPLGWTGPENDRIAALLRDLPHVKAACVTEVTKAWDHLLSSGKVHLRQVMVSSWSAAEEALVDDYPQAFCMLKRLCIFQLDADLASNPIHPASLPRLEDLDIIAGTDTTSFDSFTTPFRTQLVSLTLPVSFALSGCNLATFSALKHLALYCSGLGRLVELEGDLPVPVVISILSSVSSLRHLQSLSLKVYLAPCSGMQRGFPKVLNRFLPPELPASTRTILDTIPRQIQHLSLDTDCLRPDDVAAYLLSPRRPSRLRTLRIGRKVGRGVAEILESDEGPYGALAGTLERAGIEVTTRLRVPLSCALVGEEREEPAMTRASNSRRSRSSSAARPGKDQYSKKSAQSVPWRVVVENGGGKVSREIRRALARAGGPESWLPTLLLPSAPLAAPPRQPRFALTSSPHLMSAAESTHHGTGSKGEACCLDCASATAAATVDTLKREHAFPASKPAPRPRVTHLLGAPTTCSTVPVSALEPIRFNDMLATKHHAGRYLLCRTVAPPVLTDRLLFAVEDQNGRRAPRASLLPAVRHPRRTRARGHVSRRKRAARARALLRRRTRRQSRVCPRLDPDRRRLLRRRRPGPLRGRVGDGIAIPAVPAVLGVPRGRLGLLGAATTLPRRADVHERPCALRVQAQHGRHRQSPESGERLEQALGLGMYLDTGVELGHHVQGEVFKTRAQALVGLRLLDRAADEYDRAYALLHQSRVDDVASDSKDSALTTNGVSDTVEELDPSSSASLAAKQRLADSAREKRHSIRALPEAQETGDFDWEALEELTAGKPFASIHIPDYVGPVRVAQLKKRGGGRGVIATRDIEVGVLLIVEKAFALTRDHNDLAVGW